MFKVLQGLATRRPVSAVKDATLRKRRSRDRKQKLKLSAAGVEPPAELNVQPATNGRPKFGDDVICLPEHYEALRKRRYIAAKRLLDRLAQAPEAEAASPLACLVAVADAERETAAEARATAALVRLARSLDARNSADGQVCDGPRAVRLTTAAIPREEPSVRIQCCIGGSEEQCADAYPMRCCGQGMCAACLGAWLRLNGGMQEVEYGDRAFYVPVDGESPIEIRTSYAQGPRHEGRRYTKKIWTHHCPFCRHPVQSVRRGLDTCA